MDLDDVGQNYRKTYNLTWSGFGSSLTTTAQNFRAHEDLTDITISVGGKVFPAHKLILSAASPLLKELLKNTKCQHPILLLAGISCSDFENILDFIYRGEINVDSEKLPSLLQAAQILDIQALSPDALLVNLAEPTPIFVSVPERTMTNKSELVNTEKILKNINEVKEDTRSDIKFQKPKRTLQMNALKRPRTNDTTEFLPPRFDDDTKNSFQSNLLSTHKSYGQLRKTDAENLEDEKKIISDLPVNCKLCGVTIRQSRNLRRHIDQMHSKRKRSQKETRDDDFNEITRLKTAPLKESDDPNSDANAVTFLNFPDDSFTQLTEEILNCSNSSDLTSKENSISSSLLSVDMNSSSVQYSISSLDPITLGSTLDSSNSSASVIPSQSMPTSLDTQLSFPLPIKTSEKGLAAEVHLKCVSNNPCISDKNNACNNSDSVCNVQDMALKELENQLFSACFCSVINE